MIDPLIKGKLIIVPTPIGNLGDITLRAIEVLKNSEAILAEDTRKTGILLKHFGIENRMIAYHKFNEHKIVNILAERISNGGDLALVTDSGTPGISDPGFLLVRTCVTLGIKIESLPGPSAFIPALINSGLPCDRFCFEGFLPHKKGRSKRIDEIKDETRTMIFYESPYRITKLLGELSEALGSQRYASVSREITKIHEETIRGELSELVIHFKNHAPKGEFVVVVAGKSR